MNTRSYKNMGRAAASVVAGLVLLTSFQNCGKAGFDSELDSQSSSGCADPVLATKYGCNAAQKVEATPFAFDSGFDTISYLSCAADTVENAMGYFSIKAGAYSTGGVKIKSEFWDHADANFSPVYPAKNLSSNQYKNYLADSPKNQKAIPTVAMRAKGDLTQIYSTECTGSNVVYGRDIAPLVGDLTESLVMDTLVQKGVAANYFPFSAESKNFEASLSFNRSDSQAKSCRNFLMNKATLALTYMLDETDNYKVRAPDQEAYPVTKAYGKAYSMTFGSYPGGLASNPDRVVTRLIETNLESPGTTAKTWNCNRKYKIVRTQDAATLCPSETFADLLNKPALRVEMEVLRRQFRADQWDVNVTLQCMVPKAGTSCYKEEAITPLVEYDISKQCFSSTTGVNANARCLHFATICVRD